MLRSRLNIASRNRKGFTLIELLVVVLILAILMAVALPLYLSAVADPQKKTCRANMQTIANAVASARVKGNLPDYASFITHSVIDTTTEPDLAAVPFCPTGGTYTIAQGSNATAGASFKVNCDKDGTFEPGIDHQ